MSKLTKLAKPATFVHAKKPAVGKPEAALFGEQPGRTEVKHGEPFVGPTKKILDECFANANLQRNALYLSNIIKDLDHELSYYIKFKKSSTLVSNAGQEYLDQLKTEVQNLDCNVIIAAGNVALYALTGRTGITKWRGSVLSCSFDENKSVIPIVHPATVLPPKFQYLNKLLIKFDLVRARQLINNQISFPDREVIINPSFNDCMEYLEKCETEASKNDCVIFFDIEVYNEEVSCISFSLSKNDGISIPFIDNNGDYFPLNQETKIWLKIAKLLENPNYRKGGQNLSFDCHFLLRRYGIRTKNCEDTMIAQQTLMSEYPKGLDFITSIWTTHPYYKGEGKRWFKLGGKWSQLWHYNALDSIICAEAFPNQWEALVNQENVKTYKRQDSLIEPLVFMQEHGLKVDVDGMKKLKQSYQEKVDEMQNELNELAGKSLNPQSPKQLVNYFYFDKKFKPYKSKTGSYSTNDIAMKRLVRKGSQEAKLVRDIRKYKKLISTYLNTEKVSNDNRMRCSYNPAGTRYSRLSSSESIFGEGMNQMNYPHDMLQFLYPDDDQIFYSFDLSQAENRIVAYVGRIDQMIEAFETNKDVHSLTGALISGKTPEQVKDEDNREICCPLGGGEKTWRFWGKKCIAAGTEVLTPRGWIRIEDLNWRDTEIAQWDQNTGEISFTKATNMSTYYTNNIVEISGRNIHLEGTLNHKVPLREEGKKSTHTTLDDIGDNHHYGIPVTGIFENKESILSETEALLMVAFQADGSFNGKYHSFRFKKDRKINRIKSILESLSIHYTETKRKDNLTGIFFKGPYWLTKKFDQFLLTLSSDIMRSFIEELVWWDGYWDLKRKQYFTTSKNNADWVQTIAHLCNYTATIRIQKPTGFGKKDLYIVNFNNRNKNANLSTLTKRYKDKNSLVFGLEVQTGYFLIRSNGKISITGNSNHSLNYDMGFKSFALINEIPERDAKYLVDQYHKKYPGVRQGFHSFVKQQLSKNRTLENLMGRKTVFLDRWCDSLLKEAYSCIPQGTTGDVINERGLLYIYYNQNQFKPISLLNQVHDSVGFQIPKTCSWTEQAEMLLNIKNELEKPLTTYYGDSFSIPADLTIGCSLWKEGHGTEIKAAQIPNDVDEFAKKLKQTYQQVYEKTYGA